MRSRGKPDPEIYLTAAARLGASTPGASTPGASTPGTSTPACVVFEDAFSGIEAGLRAGMRVVALATTHTRAELAHAGADLIINDFTDPALLNWFTNKIT